MFRWSVYKSTNSALGSYKILEKFLDFYFVKNITRVSTLALLPGQLTPDEANHHFKHVLAKGKWSVLCGFHVLRHSFGANLARSGEVQMNQIGEWMGHSTQEMMEYYQHLFPQDGVNKIQMLNYA